MTDFFSLLDRLVESSALVVDRERGNPHPRISEVATDPEDLGAELTRQLVERSDT